MAKCRVFSIKALYPQHCSSSVPTALFKCRMRSTIVTIFWYLGFMVCHPSLRPDFLTHFSFPFNTIFCLPSFPFLLYIIPADTLHDVRQNAAIGIMCCKHGIVMDYRSSYGYIVVTHKQASDSLSPFVAKVA